jgi:HEAT repeat protein
MRWRIVEAIKYPNFVADARNNAQYHAGGLGVAQGLAATFGVLAKTDNKSAVRVLLSALDSPLPDVQEGALAALLSRREIAGQREILARVSDLPRRWKNVIRQHSERMTGVLRSALLEADESLCMNACLAAVMFEDYNVIPALLSAMENGSPAKADMAAETLMQLAVRLCDELERPGIRGDRRDPEWSRRHVLASLETSVQRFGRHKRREAIEAFLLLANRENAALNQILQNPHHLCFLLVMEVFSKSEQNAVMRLLLSYLDDPHPPSAALNAICNRGDPKFVRCLLRSMGGEISPAARQNLKRIGNLPWLKRASIVDYLDNAAQHGLVQLVAASGIPRNQAFATIEHLLTSGKPAGRREAARALASFNGADANALALGALGDPDPQVQAIILAHIRRRAIPGILPRLVKFIDSPHLEVRCAAQKCLAEFSFPRFVAAFDMLDEEVQRTTGELVKKVDPQTLPALREELLAAPRSRRIRGLKIAVALELVDNLVSEIVDLLRDADPDVRHEAALALDESKSSAGRRALEEALMETSPTGKRGGRMKYEG